MTNGRIKGKAAEREVAALFQAWWDPYEPGTKFVRTPMSGGWSHGDEAKEEFATAADLMTTSKTFPFSVEVKRREGWSFRRFIDGKTTPVEGWWAQTRSEARANKRIPMLWFRQNRMPWHLLLPEFFILKCWDIERESKKPFGPLPPIPWIARCWGNALCFDAKTVLTYPPDYFLAAA